MAEQDPKPQVWLVVPGSASDDAATVIGITEDELLVAAVRDKTWNERHSRSEERWSKQVASTPVAMRIPNDRDAELFKTFRSADADGDVVRSYAHTWCGHAAVSWALEALLGDETARVTLVIADHHLRGNRSYERFDLYREGDQIRDGNVMIASLYGGPICATAELAMHLRSAAHSHDAMIFRQPPEAR